MVSPHERENARTAFDLFRQLQPGFHRFRPGRAAELDLIIQAPWAQDQPLKLFKELPLRGRMEVEAVVQPVGLEIAEDALLDRRVVVAVVQGPRPREEVDILLTRFRIQERAPRPRKHGRERPTVSPDVRFKPLENRHGTVLPLVG